VSIPARIPIAREAGYRTDRIGRYDGGLFLGMAWGHYAYVHLFDADGQYRQSTIVRVEDRRTVERELDVVLTPLPDKVYGDIAVKLFQTEYDGMVFGLIDESGDRAGDGKHVDWVELYPDRLGFYEPWDGTYDT
jgi:formate hydrogenlyase regulatory protein HycA